MNALFADVTTDAGLSSSQRTALHVGPNDLLPHDPLALVLYGRANGNVEAGFDIGKLDRVEVGIDRRALMLAQAPGSERRLTEKSGSFGGLKMPTNVARAANGDIYLVDRGNAVVKYFDSCDCAFKPLPCFSQPSSAPAKPGVTAQGFIPLTQFSDPTGLAISRVNLLIADRGNHRVVIVSLIGLAPRSALRLPVATGLRRLWTPFAIAIDSTGRIFVSDPDHGRIDVFDRDGRWRMALCGLGEATHLAVDCDDILIAVIEDFGVNSTGKKVASAVEVIAGKRRLIGDDLAELSRRFPWPNAPVDRAGGLHLGAVCAVPGQTVFDLQGYPVPESDLVAPLSYAICGIYTSKALDSRRRNCIWHRVVLAGVLPDRTRVDIQTTTSDIELDAEELADLPEDAWSDVVSIRSMPDGSGDALVRSPPGQYLWLRLKLAGDGQATPYITRIVIEFPRVSLRRFLPGVYGMDPVSANFTDRFTALYDTTLRSIERRIDTLYELFDPSAAPADRPRAKARDGTPVIDFLSWLGTWIGVSIDRYWPEATRRALLKAASEVYPLRGTRTGLWRMLLAFLGYRVMCDFSCPENRCIPRPLNCAPPPAPCEPKYPPLILEHFCLCRWLLMGKGRLGNDAMIWGKRIVNRSELSGPDHIGNARVGPLDCPRDGQPATQLVSTPDPFRDPFHVCAHKFSVFVPARVKKREWQRRGLEQLLKQESPAHTKWQIEYVEPRFRVGVQAMIGLDSVIACMPAGIRLNDNRLRKGTMLPPHPGRPPEVGRNVRVGETTRLH